MLLTSFICRSLVCAGIAFGGISVAQAQTASTTNAPKLTESFTFTLDRHHDDGLRQTVETMKVRDEMQRMLDLKAVDASAFTRAIDLFRFVPFKLSSSDSKADDFFTANYLRSDYNRLTSEARLFDKP
jgi:hypothetical protein